MRPIGQFRGPALIGVLLISVACTETKYVPIRAEETGERQSLPLERIVEFDRREELLTEPPGCVVLSPIETKTVSPALAELIEDAAIRHLSVRVRRVIAGAFRDQQARYHGIVFADPKGAPALARALGCDGLVEARITEAGATYAVFFASYRMGLELRVVRVRDGLELWRSRHLSQRMTGSVPVSLGAPVAVISASSLVSDGEAVHSLVDEILRRLFVTWPSTRRLG
jgi:hypothetical protein